LSNEEGESKRESQVIVRDDFWTSTSNKQLKLARYHQNDRLSERVLQAYADLLMYDDNALMRMVVACARDRA